METEKLYYKNKELMFIELIYFNGSKLLVNIKKKYILAWNKDF